MSGQMQQDEPVAVLGAGSWGTALAILLARGRHQSGNVRLWDRNADHVTTLQATRVNSRYLPGANLSDEIYPTEDLARAIVATDCIVAAVPSGALRPVLMQLAQTAHVLPESADLVLATKGIEPDTGLWPAEVAFEVFGNRFAVVALSGPNLAAEVARGVPSAAVSACPDIDAAIRVRDRFNRETFRVYANDDRTGVEIAGAVKNVIAIAGGVCEGMGFGDNTRAFLLTRGLAEMARFGVAAGGRRETFYGLAGIGDLMATAGSKLSRNFRVGVAVAQGRPLQETLAELGQVAEGVTTVRALLPLAHRLGVEMPVCESVARLLFDGTSPNDEMASLMARLPKTE